MSGARAEELAHRSERHLPITTQLTALLRGMFQIEEMCLKALGLLVLAVWIMSSMALICDENSCQGVNCEELVPDENKLPCKANQRYTNFGTECGCCEACVTILSEGSDCPVLIDIGFPPLLEICDDDLQCRPVTKDSNENKCMKQ